jgi:hypothetical protein
MSSSPVVTSVHSIGRNLCSTFLHDGTVLRRAIFVEHLGMLLLRTLISEGPRSPFSLRTESYLTSSFGASLSVDEKSRPFF